MQEYTESLTLTDGMDYSKERRSFKAGRGISFSNQVIQLFIPSIPSLRQNLSAQCKTSNICVFADKAFFSVPAVSSQRDSVPPFPPFLL